jgi:transposase
MSHRIYTPEFKDEAVRQVVERGYTVKEVAERLGISEASLYAWRKAVLPSKDDERAAELLETKRENLTLRAELRRTQEERDILKKAAAYFARESG